MAQLLAALRAQLKEVLAIAARTPATPARMAYMWELLYLAASTRQPVLMPLSMVH